MSVLNDAQELENYHISKAKNISWRNVEGKGVILNLKSASYYTVADTSLRMWELMEKGIELSGLVKIISDEFEEDEAIVKNDVVELLDSMRKEGIIKLEKERRLDGATK